MEGAEALVEFGLFHGIFSTLEKRDRAWTPGA
jgi:hypothetical protein